MTDTTAFRLFFFVAVLIGCISCKKEAANQPPMPRPNDNLNLSPTPSPTRLPGISPTPTPTLRPNPTTVPTPSLRPSPTPTAKPTPTLVPVPSPTKGLTPTPTPTSTPTPTLVPTPIVGVYKKPFKLKIVRGTGQAIGANWQYGEPAEVSLTDANDTPVVDENLEFNITEGTDYLGVMSKSEKTDQNGRAHWNIRAAYAKPSEPSSKSRIRVRAPNRDPNLAVEFVVQALQPNAAGTLFPIMLISTPETERVIRVSKNTTLANAIQVNFAYPTGFALGQAMSEVGIQVMIDESRIVDVRPPPLVFECDGGIALSATNGIASCHLRVGAVTGSAPLLLKSFGANDYHGFTLEVVP